MQNTRTSPLDLRKTTINFNINPEYYNEVFTQVISNYECAMKNVNSFVTIEFALHFPITIKLYIRCFFINLQKITYAVSGIMGKAG